jgi:glucose/arabinose dehydrogenase
MVFYTGAQFPRQYRGTIFAAERGLWNRTRRTGYKVICVPIEGGKTTGEYDDFMVDFVTPEGNVWGQPVGVAVANDGALLVTDDGSKTLWRVSYGSSQPNIHK